MLIFIYLMTVGATGGSPLQRFAGCIYLKETALIVGS